jgi:hypothetical protein
MKHWVGLFKTEFQEQLAAEMSAILSAAYKAMAVLTVDCRIKVRLDLQADKSSVVVIGPFFP